MFKFLISTGRELPVAFVLLAKGKTPCHLTSKYYDFRSLGDTLNHLS